MATPAVLVLALSAPAALAAWAVLGSGSGTATANRLGAVTGMSAGSATETTLLLSWAAPSTGAVPSGYKITRNGGEISSCEKVTQTSCRDSGLSADTAYNYTITPTLGGWTGTASDSFEGRTVKAVAALAVSTSSLPDATASSSYSHTLAATGGTSPYAWARTAGTLPSGLSLSASGTISGTPTATGTSTFTVTVTDNAGRTASKQLSLTVTSPTAAPTVTTASLPGATQTGSYSQTLTASGGAAPLTWRIVSGVLPAGLNLNGATISGTATSAAATQTFNVEVRDSLGRTGSKSLTITVAPAPAVTTTNLPAVAVGVAYSQQLASSGGTPALTWSVASGALPAGLTLSSSGLVSGTPTGAGTSTFTARVTDSNGVAATRQLSITVNAAPTITAPTSITRQNAAQTITITGTGFVDLPTVSITRGTLGPVTFVSSTSLTVSISGTNGNPGTGTLTVTNPDGGKASITVTY